MELFLPSEDVPRHHVLTAFVERLTGFKLLDATELEDGEPLSRSSCLRGLKVINQLLHWKTFSRMGKVSVIYLLLILGPAVYLIDVGLIQCLVDVLMRWTLESQLTVVPIEGNMHGVIALGVRSRQQLEL